MARFGYFFTKVDFLVFVFDNPALFGECICQLALVLDLGVQEIPVEQLAHSHVLLVLLNDVGLSVARSHTHSVKVDVVLFLGLLHLFATTTFPGCFSIRVYV